MTDSDKVLNLSDFRDQEDLTSDISWHIQGLNKFWLPKENNLSPGTIRKMTVHKLG